MLIKLDYIFFFIMVKKYNLKFINNLKFCVIILSFCFYKLISSYIVKFNSLHLNIVKTNCLNVLKVLKNSNFFLCKQLVDFTVIDLLEMPSKYNDRFEFVYMLLSVKLNIRVFVRGVISLFDFLESASSLFNSANWMEREIWDMFGIFFINNLDLRRILTDYGFNGYPFRKDFPLSGYVEVRYDDIKKIVIMEPLELSQEYRFFRLEMPWQNF